jgi:hypothetical protein
MISNDDILIITKMLEVIIQKDKFALVVFEENVGLRHFRFASNARRVDTIATLESLLSKLKQEAEQARDN